MGAEMSRAEQERVALNPCWPEGIKAGESYQIYCDDKGRDGGVWLRVFVANDGDVHVSMQDWEEIKEDPESKPSPFPSLRVRTVLGGGRNTRTRQALLWLAKAMMLDHADNPEEPYHNDREWEAKMLARQTPSAPPPNTEAAE